MPRAPRVRIRLATAEDERALARIFTHAFAPMTVRRFRAWRDRPTKKDILVAEVDGVVASTLTIEYREFWVDGVAVPTGGIAAVATHWDYRGRGLATRLLREAHRRLREGGVSNASLFTARSLPAIRIYERHGYSEVIGWRSFRRYERPVDVLQAQFAWRSRWIARIPHGRAAVSGWRERVLVDGGGWRATVTYDGSRFRVRSGRRGSPTLVMEGDTTSLFRCFQNRLAFDALRRRGTVRLSGAEEAVATWRRIVTLEWTE